MKFLLLLLCLPAFAAQFPITWDPNDPADAVTNYRVYSWVTQRWVGAQWVPAHWTKLADCGTSLTYVIDFSDHYGWFSVTAWNRKGQSPISNVLTLTNSTFARQIRPSAGPLTAHP